MILGGDIGGTKTHLALFEISDELRMLSDKKYISRDYKDLQSVINDFLIAGKERVTAAAFAVPGPVEEEKCRTTNLPWVIDSVEISKAIKIPKVFLLNDMEANAWGIRLLKPEEFCLLNPAGIPKKGNAAIIAAGTGLGEAGLYWDGHKHCPFPCEGGHVDFAPRDENEIGLWRFLQKNFGRVSYERLLSGPGLYNIYRFLVETGKEQENLKTHQELQKRDPPHVITEAARKKQCKASVRTLNWFVSIYGAEAGNLALKFLSTGGVYIGGGIAPKILPFLKTGAFLESFVAKGRFEPLLKTIPVQVILNENTALLGAAYYVRVRYTQVNSK